MKFTAKYNDVDAIQFLFTPEGVAALAQFTGDDFKGILTETTNKGQKIALIGTLRVIEGSFIFKRKHGYGALSQGVFNFLYAQDKSIIAPADAIAAAKAATTEAIPAPVVDAPVQAPIVYTSIAEAMGAAYAKGETTFKLATPCKHGHFAERYTSNGNCVVCMKDARDRYNAKQKRRAYQREYYRQNLSKEARERQATEALSRPEARWAAPVTSLVANMGA